jgi:hypothetical protein
VSSASYFGVPLNILPSKLIRLLLFISFCLPTLSLPCAAASAKPNRVSLPIVFEENQGQAPSEAAFLSRSSGAVTFYRPGGIDIRLPGAHSREARIRMTWLHALTPTMLGEQALPGHSSYLIGNDSTRWLKGIRQFGQIRYQHLYPGVDLVFHGSGDSIEHDFLVQPGTPVSSIAFRLDRPARVLHDGSLEVTAGTGSIRFARPVAYQEMSGERRQIEASFQMHAEGAITFRVGSYDPSRVLVIDPVLTFSTYLSGTTQDQISAVTTDTGGNVYVTGTAGAIDFPVQNPEQATNYGNDAFVSKLDSTGHTLLYSTFLGGTQGAQGGSIAVDRKGNIVVAGTASGSDFPQAGAIQPITCQTNYSCFFLTSFKADGVTLNYSGLVGGTDYGAPTSGSGHMALDSTGNAYLSGNTWDSHFPLTPGSYGGTTEPSYPLQSLFVLKVDATGKLIFSTLVPGNSPYNPAISYNNFFQSQGIAVDGNGQAIVAGTAGPGLPKTSGVLASTFPNDAAVGNASAGFLLQLNSTATALNYATYLPGTDTAGGMAIAGDGSIYITGATSELNLPVSSTAYQKTLTPGPSCTCNSGYVMKLDNQAKTAVAATYLSGIPSPGNEGTYFQGVALDSHSNVVVGGMTGSPNFPLVNPFVTQWETTTFVWDMVVAELSPDLSQLLFGSFLNSTTDLSYAGSTFEALTVDPNDRLIVTGSTFAQSFPTTSGSFEPTLPPQPSNIGYGHAFVASLDLSIPAPSVCLANWSVAFGLVPAQTTGSQNLTLTNCGNGPLHLSSYASSSPFVGAEGNCSDVAAGATCTIVMSYLPENSDSVSGTLTLSDNAAIPTQVLSFAGQGLAGRLAVSPTPVEFGHLLVGTQGLQTVVGLGNAGTADLTISAVAASGDFSVSSNTCLTTLPKGWPCRISLSFAPKAEGARTGSLVISSNDPQNPQLTVMLTGAGDAQYATPSITSIDRYTAQVGASAQTLQITGMNFYPASVVNIKGAPQATAFESNTLLTATLDATSVASIGEEPVTVANPAPGGGVSNAVTLTPYQTLPIGASALISVPASGMLYASIPASSLTNPNTVVPIDPKTGKTGSPIPVGNDPRMMTASDDGKYIYVALVADQTIQRVNLQTSAVERTFAFPAASWNPNSSLSVNEVHVVPGANQSLVVAFTGILALYNDAGLVNAVPNSYPGLDITSFTFADDPSTFYGLPLDFGSNSPEVFTINSAGIQTTVPSGRISGTYGTGGLFVVSDGRLLYTNIGTEWDPITPKLLGSFLLTIENLNSPPRGSSVAVDPGSDGMVYFLGDESFGNSGSALVLSAFDKTSFKLLGSLSFGQATYPVVNSLTRWGANGFSFIAPGATGQEVYILTSNLTGSTITNPQPTLASISPSSAPEGGSDFTLTVNGTGFTNTSAVTWNHTPRTTTYISPTQLTAAISSDDIAEAGTAYVGVQNPAPGGGASTLLVFTIAAPAGQLSFSPNPLVFGNESIGLTSSGQSVTVTNSGGQPVSIASEAVTGAFSATDNCGGVLAPGAVCQVNVTFTPTSPGAQTGTLTFTDSAAGTPQTVVLSGIGVASSLTIVAGGGGSTSATVGSGQTATYNLSLTGTTGLSGTVTLTCTGAPAGASCTISPATLDLASGQTSNFTVSVSTNGSSASALVLKASIAGFGLVSLLLLPLGRNTGTVRTVLFSVLVACGAAGVLSGCGGGQSSNSAKPPAPTSSGVMPGTYTLKVIATGGSVSVTQSLSLTVQ